MHDKRIALRRAAMRIIKDKNKSPACIECCIYYCTCPPCNSKSLLSSQIPQWAWTPTTLPRDFPDSLLQHAVVTVLQGAHQVPHAGGRCSGIDRRCCSEWYELCESYAAGSSCCSSSSRLPSPGPSPLSTASMPNSVLRLYHRAHRSLSHWAIVCLHHDVITWLGVHAAAHGDARQARGKGAPHGCSRVNICARAHAYATKLPPHS